MSERSVAGVREEGKGEVLVFGGRVIGYRLPPDGVADDRELDKIFAGTEGGRRYCPPCRLIYNRPDDAPEKCPKCGGPSHSPLRAMLDAVERVGRRGRRP